jgi:hypothetical protein
MTSPRATVPGAASAPHALLRFLPQGVSRRLRGKGGDQGEGQEQSCGEPQHGNKVAR